MTQLNFVLPDGSQRRIDAVDGRSVMETAIANDIGGIVAECNGSMACATCHIFVDDATAARLGPPSHDEDEMLDFAATERRETSRLCCQIEVGKTIEGATFTVPEAQV